MAEHDLGETVDTEKARIMLAGRDAVAVDIRDEDAWREGRIAAALHVPEEELDERLDELPRDQPLLVVCDRGERSREVAARLRDEGFEAASIDGGMHQWFSDKQPAQPSDDPDDDAVV